MAKTSYTLESVERALGIHTDEGRIIRWHRDPDRPNRWHVVNVSGDSLELRSLREAYVFVWGVGSCSHAMARRTVNDPNVPVMRH